jgi:hypothetical protein
MPGSWGVVGRGRELEAVAAFLDGGPSGMLLRAKPGSARPRCGWPGWPVPRRGRTWCCRAARLGCWRRPGARGEPALPAGAGLAGALLGRLWIGPLAATDFEAAIWASAGERLSRLIIRRVFEASSGNLFYGLQLARALGRAQTEPLPGEPLPVPASLQGVLSARIAALPAEVQDVLLAASCVRSPTALLLERAIGPQAWPAVQSAAAEGVVEAEALGSVLR